jgi:hypothetical protein
MSETQAKTKKVTRKRKPRAPVEKAMTRREPMVLDKAPPLLAQAGRTGLRRNGGLIDEEYISDLKGRDAAKVYREMSENEAVLAASLWTIEILLQQTAVMVEPADDTPQAKEVADFVEGCLWDVDGGWHHVLNNALSMMVYGYALLEKVYKIRRGPLEPPEMRSRYTDGRIGWRKLALRSANSVDRWDYDENTDSVVGVWQLSPSDNRFRYLPMTKLLHFRLKAPKDNPEGVSLLRSCYTSYYYVKQFRFVEAVGIERYIAGMPVMQVPPEVMLASVGSDMTAIRTMYENLVREVRVDEQAGLVLPSEVDREGKPTGYKFSLLSAGGSRPADVDPVIRRYESREAMTLLTEVMLLGTDAMGSYALSKDKTELLVVGLNYILEAVLDKLADEAVPELVRLNGWPTEISPKLNHGNVKAPNLADLASFIGSIAGAGAFTPDRDTEDALREAAGLPQSEGAAVFAPPVGEDLLGDYERPDVEDDREPAAPADTGEAEGLAGEPASAEVQQTALNGAQIASMQGIVIAVAAGELPRDSAIAIIETAFQLPRGQAERIVGEAGEGPVPTTTAATLPPAMPPQPSTPTEE